MKEKLHEYNFKRRLFLLSILTIILSCVFPIIAFVINQLDEKNVYNSLFNNPECDLKVHFIDVGEGKAILINVENKNILIDTGDRSQQDKFLTYLKAYFDFHNSKTLDYLILTHADADHIGNVPEVCEMLDVKVCYRPKQFLSNEIIDFNITSKKNIVDSDYYENAINALNEENCEVLFNSVGEMISGLNFKLEFLSPNKEYYSDSNNYSPIMILTYLGKTFMFTGDAGEEVEESILKFQRKIDVLDVAHHGSRYSSSEKFLKCFSPEFAVVSVSKDNTYGHPSIYVLERLINVGVRKENILCTSEFGSIVFTVNKDSEILIQTSGQNNYLMIPQVSLFEYWLVFEFSFCFYVFLLYKPKKDKNFI